MQLAVMVQLYPDDPMTYTARGLLALRANRGEEAIQLLRRAAALAPETSICHQWLGFGCLRLARWSEAREAFQNALRYAPYEIIAADAKAGIAIADGQESEAKGDLDGALIHFDQAVGLNPNDVNTFLARGKARMSKRDAEGALTDFNKAVELRPDWAQAYAGRGAAELALGDLDKAQVDLNKAIELNPNLPEVLVNRGILDMRKGELDSARDNFNSAVAQFPELLTKASPLFAKLGRLRYERHEFAEALVDFRRALEAGFKDDFTAFAIWLIRSRFGEKEAATKELQAYLNSRKSAGAEDWVLKVGSFLAGQLTEAELFKAAESPDKKKSAEQHCEACFYAGTKRLIDGDKLAATTFFEKCLATEVKEFIEYTYAAAELERLKAER